jgi:hypothetical protein
VPGERPRLEDGAGGSERLHDLRAAADGADGEPPADDLAERGHVRLDAELALGAGEPPDAEAGDHLVEDQESAVLVTELPEPFVVAVDGVDDTLVRQDRLDD